MSRAAVFEAATRGAGALPGIPDLGRLKVGAPADLLLLAANPIEDLDHLRRPLAVIRSGVPFRRDALDRRVAEIKARRN